MIKQNLVLILARGGSKNIYRQNLRLVNNKPLLYYILNTALKSNVGDVYVSTDSEEIREVTLQYDGKVLPRPLHLTRDSTRIEEIVLHALTYLKKKGLCYNKCLVLSPVFPFIEPKTIRKFFSSLNPNQNSIIGFKENKEIYREIRPFNKKLVRLLKIKKKMVNAKQIISFDCPSFLKSGHIPEPAYGTRLTKTESITVDDYHDLDIVEKILNRSRILVRVDGRKKIGLGHVYNMLTILNCLRENDILIVMNSRKKLGNYKFKQQLYKVKYFKNKYQLNEIIAKFKPDIILNDILDTTKSYICELKRTGSFIVNFEDLGKGSDFADLVFNSIYQVTEKVPKKYFGIEYACVRDEFRILKSKPSSKTVKKILITFGGSDPSNLTVKVLKIIASLQMTGILICIVLGFAFLHKQQVLRLIKKMRNKGYKIEITENSDLMAKHIRDSDLVITSNGRTVLEVASLKVPIISVSANKREELHSFTKNSKVAIHLGYYSKLTTASFSRAMNRMMKLDYRKKLIKNLEKIEILKGVDRVIDIIINEYGKKKEALQLRDIS